MKKMLLMAAMAVFCLGMNAQTPQKKSGKKTEKTEQCCKTKACKSCKDDKCKAAKCKACKCADCHKQGHTGKDTKKGCCKDKK